MCYGSSLLGHIFGSPLHPMQRIIGILYTFLCAKDIWGLTKFPIPEFYI